MEKRKYSKKSNYWDKFNQQPLEDQLQSLQGSSISQISPVSAGEAYYTSDVSTASTYQRTSQGENGVGNATRINRSAVGNATNRFSSIRMGLLPYEYASDGVNVREAIELCQKAYANIAVFRNSIDVMSEFANGDVYLEGGNNASRDFFYKWFNKIRLWDLKDQFFREYYRSGNVFMYRVDGTLNVDDFKTLNKIYANNLSLAADPKIPIKYILLNPFSIVAKRATSFTLGAYEKILSEYDLERLRNPKDDYDVEILKSFPPDVRDKIKKGQFYTTGLLIKLDNTKLSYVFYKKQDYEPFSIPFGYPVLDDINAKLELKKMDQAITRTVENVILLIKMGAPPDKGGINPHNLQAMQQLFLNESVGRVLVSDYTTEAEFIIPDIAKILGPQKYEVLNEDIRQGLQNVMVGSEKYNTTEVKTRIFMDKLNESRRAFLNDFLQREIKRVSKDMGFKSYPTAKFVDMDSKNETEILRITTRLMELGVITPQQGLDVFNTGSFPKSEDIELAQEDFVKNRKKGYYNPVVGGVPMMAAPTPKLPAGSTPIGAIKVPAKPAATNNTPKSGGRPVGTKKVGPSKTIKGYSRKNIQAISEKVEDLFSLAKQEFKLKFNSEGELNNDQIEMVNSLCESIICSSQIDTWQHELKSCVNDINKIEQLQTLDEVLNISTEHELETYPSAILYHSEKINE